MTRDPDSTHMTQDSGLDSTHVTQASDLDSTLGLGLGPDAGDLDSDTRFEDLNTSQVNLPYENCVSIFGSMPHILPCAPDFWDRSFFPKSLLYLNVNLLYISWTNVYNY